VHKVRVGPVGTHFHFDPATYLDMVRDEVPAYDRLQSALAEATTSVEARRILDLGSGTGVTAERVLSVHRGAQLVGIDCSGDMLAHARRLVPTARFVTARLQDPLPSGPFDLVVSAFTVHHLDRAEKADLFARVAAVLRPGGRFVLCDVVVPEQLVARPVPLDDGFDLPSTVGDQVAWLTEAGLRPEVVYAQDDLCILSADRPIP